ncbi:replication initiation protein [Aliarcobacter cryaerophilus]|uniref:replication initiation protein n=1 Tax=Aliarcobacter cryaerophilus TaxID=28198 RepID=UPI003DA6056B
MEEKKENNFLVVKHNSLINFKTKTSYTLNQLKLVCYLISNIKPEDKGFQLKRICIKDLGLSSIDSKNHKKLSGEFLDLMCNPFKLPDKKTWVSWFSSFSYEEGVIEYKFDPLLKPFLLQLKDNFATYQLKNILSLKSAYSIRMYELLNQYKVIGKRTIEIEELKLLLNIPDSYRNNDILKLLEKIKKELTSKTDLTFDFEAIKESRQFKSFEFTIQHNNSERTNKVCKKKEEKDLSVKNKLKTLRIK